MIFGSLVFLPMFDSINAYEDIQPKPQYGNVFDIPLVGFSLNFERETTKIDDYSALLKIYFDELKTSIMQVDIITSIQDYFFTDIEISTEIYYYKSEIEVIKLSAQNSKNDVFLDLYQYSSYIQVDLSFDGGDSQFNYFGMEFGASFGFNETYLTNMNKFSIEKPSESFTSDEFSMYYEEYEIRFLNSIKTFKKPTNSEAPSAARYTYHTYMVIHQCGGSFGLDNEDFAEDIVDTMEDDGDIDIDYGIWREGPTETQIKSDLQYYNKDTEYYYMPTTLKDIVAYEYFGHGNEDQEWCLQHKVYDQDYGWIWEYFSPSQYIDSSEISNLWGTTSSGPYYYYTYMYDAIILTYSCLNWGSNISIVPEMGEAFVDDGDAASWVGFTIELQQSITDHCSEAFWYELADGTSDVYDATIAMCDEYVGYTYGTNCGIYGSTSQTL
ncbi:MAG: hypothetical protein ACTSRK_04955 [Promethearchaeota archaeon]